MRTSLSMLGSLLGGLLACMLASALPSSVHAQALDAYEGEVAVVSQSEPDRLAALAAALGEVFVKRTGDPGAANDSRLSSALADAAALVQQFRYRQDERAGRTYLIARFEAGAVDRALSAAGRTLWPEPRPQPVVWLAIDDGRGPRLLGSAQAQAVAALTARATQRGLRLTYPLLDVEDQQRIDAAKVWASDQTTAQAAAQRYNSSTVLMGKLYREGALWVAEWQVLQDGEQLARESTSNADSAIALAAGAELAANALSARYAIDLASAGSPGRFNIRVAGIGSAEDYARLLGQLRRMPIVREVDLTSAQADAMLLIIDMSTGIAGFTRSANGIGLLTVDQAANSDTSIDVDPNDVDPNEVDPTEVHRFRLLP